MKILSKKYSLFSMERNSTAMISALPVKLNQPKIFAAISQKFMAKFPCPIFSRQKVHVISISRTQHTDSEELPFNTRYFTAVEDENDIQKNREINITCYESCIEALRSSIKLKLNSKYIETFNYKTVCAEVGFQFWPLIKWLTEICTILIWNTSNIPFMKVVFPTKNFGGYDQEVVEHEHEHWIDSMVAHFAQ